METKRSKTKIASMKNRSWRAVVGVVVAPLLVVGMVVAFNRNEPPTFEAKGAQPVPAKAGSKQYVTLNGTGQPVVINQQTGQSRPLTPQEQQTLAEGIKQLVNQETDGLVQIEHANGAVSMNLQGRFQNVTLARKDSDGSVSESCVNDLETAANFFQIDPVLLGVAVSNQPAASEKFPVR